MISSQCEILEHDSALVDYFQKGSGLYLLLALHILADQVPVIWFNLLWAEQHPIISSVELGKNMISWVWGGVGGWGLGGSGWSFCVLDKLSTMII